MSSREEAIVSRTKARDVMNARILTVSEEMSVQELATFLIDHEISGAPVEDADGRLVGLVSTTDLARNTAEVGSVEDSGEHPFFHSWAGAGLDADDLAELHIEEEGLTVREIMTPTVFAVAADAPVSHVARSMLDGHLHRLLVIDSERVVGIVSTSDLLRLLAESDG
jgi:CBS domain-containing protein